MSDALSYAEIDSQNVELLPARTVMSTFTMTGGKDGGEAGHGVGGDSAAKNISFVEILTVDEAVSKGGTGLGGN
ncbi:MAG: hypothetical protein M3460_07135 [Actinomycetota bacterium]|nr:hypothetical protein [Actinomycetota bacterium]